MFSYVMKCQESCNSTSIGWSLLSDNQKLEDQENCLILIQSLGGVFDFIPKIKGGNQKVKKCFWDIFS